MNEEKVRETIEDISRLSVDHLKRNGDHPMIGLAYSDKGREVIPLDEVVQLTDILYRIGLHGRAMSAKEAMSKAIKKHLKETGAFGLIVVSEMWITEIPKDNVQIAFGDEPGRSKVIGPIARFDKNRKEALSVTWEFKLDDGKRFEGIRSWVFHRKGIGEIEMDPPKTLEGSPMGGLFTGFIE